MLSVLVSVRHDTKLVSDPLRNVKPVQLRMTDRRLAAVKFPCAADNTSSSVEITLQLVCHGLWSTGQHDVTMVNLGRHESVHERRS